MAFLSPRSLPVLLHPLFPSAVAILTPFTSSVTLSKTLPLLICGPPSPRVPCTGWILSVLRPFPSSSPRSLIHVRAHMEATDPASVVNGFVDHLASGAQTSLPPPHPVPLPTFFMDKFTPYLPPLHFIGSHLPALLGSLLASRSLHGLSFGPLHILCPFFYDSFTPPPHPYLCASSTFSAAIQLYARSAQLPTNIPLASRFGGRSTFCRYGCPALEDPHHVLVACPAFQGLLDKYPRLLISDTPHHLCGAALPAPIRSHTGHITTYLFWDDDSWPLGSSCFYLGLLPPLLPNPRQRPLPSSDAHRVLVRVAHSCHISSTRLAT